MAANLANLVVPSVFASHVAAQRDKLNSFVKSGAAVVSPQLSTLLAGGAKSFNLPYWKAISGTGIVPSTDYETKAAVQKVSGGTMTAVRLLRAISPIAVTDLEGLLVGEDPVAAAEAQIAEAHNEIRQTSLLGMLGAVTAVDSADGGVAADLLYNDAGTSLNGTMLAKGIQSVWGDQVKGLAGMTLVMNSLEFLDLQSNQITGAANLAFPNAVDVGFGTFMGATIVVDDTVADNTVYVIRRGGLAFGSAALASPFAIVRDEFAGTAAGADIVFSRDLFGYHVAGSSYTGAIAADVATDAEISNVANWTLAKDKKFCGVMKVTHAA